MMNANKICILLMIAATVYMTSAGSEVKRADDSNPLEAVVDTHSLELTQLKAQIQALKDILDKRAAFRAPLNAAVVANAPIKFDQGYSLGGGYDPHTGVYTVPISGVYSFHFQLFPPALADILIDVYLNGGIVIRSRCYDSAAYTTSCSSSSIFHVSQGDTIWLQSGYAAIYYSDPHSYFSGVLVSPDP